MRRRHRVLGLPIFLAVVAALSAVVMLLWNAIIPAVIGWTTITYWQALGLMVLCRILFGGFKKSMHSFGGMNPKEHQQFHEKLRCMSMDERRDFIRQRMAKGYSFDKEQKEETEE